MVTLQQGGAQESDTAAQLLTDVVEHEDAMYSDGDLQDVFDSFDEDGDGKYANSNTVTYTTRTHIATSMRQ